LEKILFIRRPGAFGGIEVLLLDWMQQIDRSRTTISLVSTLECFGEKIRESGLLVEYRIVRLPTIGSVRRIFSSWYREIRTISPDKVVILEGTVDEVPVSAVLAAYLATGGNVYMTEHLAWPFPPPRTRSTHFGFLPGLGLWWHRRMWGIRLRSYLSRRVLAVSEAVKEVLVQYGYREEKISIAYHGVDVDRFAPSESARKEWRRRHGVPDGATVIVSTSRLAREKKLERVLHSFAALSSRRDDLWLVIAGEGPLRDELSRVAQSQRGGERVVFLGLVSDVCELLQASDVFVLPSDREGLSVSLTEAMSTGLLCVASNVSGSNEVICDGENGYLVEPDEAGVLGGLERALNLEGAARERLTRNARNTIIERFEKGKSVARILDLLGVAGSATAP